MIAADLEKLFERIARIKRRIERHDGDGARWQYTFPEGDTTTYLLGGVKSPEVVEDEIRELLTWWWNGKDYLKKRARVAGGVSPNAIEEMVNNDRALAICADLANGQKHGGLDPSHRPRSGEDPALAPVKYTANSSDGGIRSIAFAAGGVVAAVFDPEKTEITMEVTNGAGVVVGDALELLEYAVSRWEEVLAQLPQ